MNYLQKLLKINAKKLDFILILILSLFYNLDINNLKTNKMKTYDVHFNDNNDSNSKGFEMTIEDAKAYITSNNGTNNSYFADYKGGTVSVVCNQDGETVYEVEVK